MVLCLSVNDRTLQAKIAQLLKRNAYKIIGYLSISLTINNIDRAIRSDFRVALSILVAYNSEELNDQEKMSVMLECFYEKLGEIPVENIQEALIKASLFLDGRLEETSEHTTSNEKRCLIGNRTNR